LGKSIWAGGVAQVIECRPSKHEALSSNSSATKKKKTIHYVIQMGYILEPKVSINHRIICSTVIYWEGRPLEEEDIDFFKAMNTVSYFNYLAHM
jgi:hypothetical protein